MMQAGKLRTFADPEIVRFSLEEFLGYTLSEKPSSLDMDLRFDARKQAVWRACDYDAYRILYPLKKWIGHQPLATAHLILMGKRLGLYVQPNHAVQGLVIYPRDAVIVTVAKSHGIAIKVVRKTANTIPVVENERHAYELLPEFVPPVINLCAIQQSESFQYLVSQFAPNNHPIVPREWPSVFPSIMNALFLCYERGGFKTLSTKDIVEQAIGTLEKHRIHTAFYEVCRTVIHDICRVCLQFKDAEIITAFVHGDITWDAVHRDRGSMKIIDWGNAGYKSVFYDLFIQEFYRRSRIFWAQMLHAESIDFFNEYFFGAFKGFHQFMTKRIHAPCTLVDIKANLVVSLLENAVEHFTRYCIVDETEGMEFFKLVGRIRDFLYKEHSCPVFFF